MYGIVLEGGGAKGSYQAGAYKAISENGLGISAVAGTSIGALNGAMIVQGEFETCINLWNDIRYSDIIRDNDQEINRLLHARPDRHTVKVVADKLRGVIWNKGFDISPFKEMIAKHVNEEAIRSSSIEFGISTYNLTDRTSMELFKEDIPEGEMKDYLLASAYMPFFKLEKIGGKTLLDGWFSDNLPYHMLLQRGYENLIILRTHQMEPGDLDELSGLNPMIISPSEDLGRTFDLDGARIRKNMKMGYLDASREIKGLVGKRYYIFPKDEDFYFQYLADMGEHKIRALGELLNIDASPSLSLLFGQIIPRLWSMLDIEKDHDYQWFVISILELALTYLGKDRFEIYQFLDLRDYVISNGHKLPSLEATVHDTMINRFGKLVPFNREEILLRAAGIMLTD
ncbi:patatin-like phospholipase family protein [Gudongella sp. SC589]|uniref:patatin-like phospholipase family protein n=1 Tax=Gudongella sp. SC589 TaxID=3385990 RepID=UPI00390488C8